MIVNTRIILPPMRLPSVATTTTTSRRQRRRMVVSFSFPIASTVDTDKLRTQLDQLHAESENTRTRANNARMRFMRLSEAAENFQQGAAAHVLVGKESEAREMLIQRKKLMQALEKSKKRLEALDELSAKINEAISLKEAQLIENVSMAPEFSREDSSHQIRFIYPKDVSLEDSDRSHRMGAFHSDSIKPNENQKLEVQSCDPNGPNLPADGKLTIMEEAASIDTPTDDNVFSSFKNITSYEDFLRYVDRQLREVEADLGDFLKLSTLILENEHKDTNIKARQTSEILKDVCKIRGRIASILKS